VGIWSARDISTTEKRRICNKAIICSTLPGDRTGGGAWALLTSLVVSGPLHMSLVNRDGDSVSQILLLSSFLCKTFDSRVSPAFRMDTSKFLQRKEWRDLRSELAQFTGLI